ncbi:serine hydrolase [Actinomadura craniellae]|uniref:Serine hydrolase n=1 Tax=Actinomadura craniellae TaxID=2231787 RepID=A0A365H0H3_9ACTN|nr:serine hydrolase domain-containing protein [Actinomadura craniellae]RAY12571.1 serine hydrolase [Actinomadura craniellae]
MELAPEKTGFAPARLERITEHFERAYIEPGKIAGCQVAVTRHGHLAYFRSFGQMDRETGKAMADDAVFRIYSMTKPITSVALMTLYERGLFQLNDPVSRFFPAWRKQRVWVSGAGPDMVTEEPVRPPTMRDMLCHTGGITYGTALADVGALGTDHPVDLAYDEVGVRRGKGETLTEFMDKLAEVPLRYQPGERWMYSFSTDVCGALVERISGRRFDRYLREEIFEPLGMADTSFVVPADRVDRFCANYHRAPDKSLVLADAPGTSRYLREPNFFSGGGGLTSTTADYLRFCEMLRRGGELDGARVLGPRTLALMHRNHLKGGRDLAQMAIASFSETANEGVGFGLGFATTLDAVTNGGICAGDYYWGGAASTIFWVDPVEDLTVVFMTQVMPSRTFDFRGQLKNLVYSSIVD